MFCLNNNNAFIITDDYTKQDSCEQMSQEQHQV